MYGYVGEHSCQTIHEERYGRRTKRLGLTSQLVKTYLPDKFGNIIGYNIITDSQGEHSKEIMTMGYARMVCVLWKLVQHPNERVKALEPK